MTGLVVAGWVVAAALGAGVAILRGRLELVARAEHELRGPLAALSLATESLRREPGGNRVGSALETQLERARAGLADLAAARTGRRATYEPRRVALDRLVGRAVAGWEPVARYLGRTVRIDWAAGPVTVRADDRRLQQVIGNLISNAVEHGEGRVEVRGRRRSDRIRLEISDGGRGFQPRRREAPVGRGLKIATRAVEEAGGTLIAPAGEGKSIVAVELPVEHV